MKRFFGMMPRSEIEIEKVFKDSPDSNFKETIQAGPNGWTIIWADGGSTFKDESIGTEKNFKNALEYLKESFPEAIELNSKNNKKEMEE